MRKTIVCFFIMLLLVTAGHAQVPVKVTGYVSDDLGPIVGVNVIIQNSTRGTITDVNGNFTIEVQNPETDVLVFKSIGYKDSVEPLRGRTSGINITMVESISQLDDVVVIGYGTQKRGNLTGAVSSIQGSVLQKVPVASVAEALVGKLPGVQITAVDGSPDAEIMIRVRGGGSITEDNSPLILVDGFEVRSLNDIPPSDIESIEVLKDAASTAIYGARGANGVILVTTANPKEGKITWNINSYVQMKTLANRLDVMDPYEFVMMQYEYERQRSSNPTGFFNRYGKADELYIYQGQEGTDWQDELFGSNPIAKYMDINMNGGTQKTKYKFSFVHQDQPGVLVGSGMQQNNFNVSLNTKLTEKLTFEYRTRLLDQRLDGAGTEGVSLLRALREAPTLGLDDYMELPDDNEYFDPEEYTVLTRFDPYEEAEKNYRKRTTRSFNTMGALRLEIIKGLSFRTEFGYEYRYQDNERYWGTGTSTANANNNQPVIEWTVTESPRWQVSNVLNYNFKIDEVHDFQLMLGQEMKENDSKQKVYRSRYFPENITGPEAFDNLSLGTPYENSSAAGSPVRLSSFFGRANYGYADRYLATVTVRADGSTHFSPENQWGVFPAAAVAWRLSNENFLVGNATISNLKMRLSYGLSGNDRISGDLYAKYYGVYRSRSVGWGEQDHYYYNFYNTSYLYNSDIKWETTITRNAGIDFGFFKERLNGSLDVYYNTVEDLLVPSDIPGHSGYTKIMSNVGQTSNKGVELALNGYIVDGKEFKLNVGFNIARNKNRIDNLASGESEWILSSGWAGSQLLNTDDYRAIVGSQRGLIYGFVNDGFYSMDDFESFNTTTRTWTLKHGIANSKNLSGDPRPGNAKFKKLTPVDENDPNSYVIGDNDRQVIGNTNPEFSGGFTINSSWKNFDLALMFNFIYGFDVYNANKIMMTSWYSNSNNNLGMEVSLDKRWRNYDDMGNEIRYSPEILAEFNKDATMWNPTSLSRPVAMSYAIEDGSFLRLNTASLGYTIPKSLINKVGLANVRFYATGTNLLLFTNYSGYDPEVNIETGLTPNIDYNAYPRSRNYTLGVQLTF
jgi:TonB-dependent starch-binding outer membrane protein SusC